MVFRRLFLMVKRAYEVPFVTLQKRVRNTRVLPARPPQAGRPRAQCCSPDPQACAPRHVLRRHGHCASPAPARARQPAWADQVLRWKAAEMD